MATAHHHTYADDALGGHDAVEVARMIRQREISATEVIDAATTRAENSGPIGAIVVDTFASAAVEARDLDARPGPAPGAFAGVPTFIKDQIDVVGLPTRFGSDAHANAAPAKKNDPVAQQLFTMGLVSLGKSTLPGYGFIPSTEFPDGKPTRNPWNLAHTAGGSSGGAAALVAAGVVPIAHAADGGGSIRIPAACCGLVGMKPSRGRIPRSAMHEPFVGLVTDGVVSRTVRDTAQYLAEVERLTPNRKLLPVGHVRTALQRPLRIGVNVDPPLGLSLDGPTRQALTDTVDLLASLGHEVTEVELPVGEQSAVDFRLFWSMLGGLVTATAKRTRDRNFDATRVTEFTRGLGQQARASKRALPGTIRRMRATQRTAAEFFQTVDVVLTPTSAALSPALGELQMTQSADVLFPKLTAWVPFTPWANVAGIPSLSLPLGFAEEQSLPIGMLFTAGLGQEGLLLELALQLEAAQPFRSLQPA